MIILRVFLPISSYFESDDATAREGIWRIHEREQTPGIGFQHSP